MTNIITYESKNAKPHERWLAYAVLPNGQQWLVRCTGETEEIAATKAKTLYEAEKAKKLGIKDTQRIENLDFDKPFEGPEKLHHLAGKIWMINKATGDKKRIDPSEEDQYKWAGYERGGPRS